MRVRRPLRPYFFEVFTLANVLVLHAIIFARGIGVSFAEVWLSLRVLLPNFFFPCLVGVVLRLLYAWVQKDRSYLRRVRSREWLLLSARLIVALAISTNFYAWLKLLVPILHRVWFDGALWSLDRAIFLGHSPNVLFLEIFKVPPFIRFIDWSYAQLFFFSLYLAIGFLLSHPSNRIRIAFMNGNLLLWTVGAWLYLLVPSMGPAYRFSDVWRETAQWFPTTRALQREVLMNFLEVRKLALGQPYNILLFHGIAAFPSLHVAFQVFVALWVRHLSRALTLVFDLLAVLILLGSVITGWHYLIDGIAGIVLAAICYYAGRRLTRRKPARPEKRDDEG